VLYLGRDNTVRLVGCSIKGSRLLCGMETLELNPVGSVIAARLIEAEYLVGDLVDNLAEHFGIEHDRIRRDLRQFLTSVDNLGIVQVRSHRPTSWSRRLWMLVAAPSALEWLDRPQHRHPPTISGAMIGITKAYSVPIALTLLALAGMTTAMARTSAVQALPLSRLALAASIFTLAAGGLATVVAHETGHLLMARMTGSAPLAFVSGPLRIHLRRSEAPSATAGRLIALAGPLAGAVLGLMLALAFRQLDVPAEFTRMPLLWSVAHLGCILPVFGDGKQVFAHG
jgi:hypothetical protein